MKLLIIGIVLIIISQFMAWWSGFKYLILAIGLGFVIGSLLSLIGG